MSNSAQLCPDQITEVLSGGNSGEKGGRASTCWTSQTTSLVLKASELGRCRDKIMSLMKSSLGIVLLLLPVIFAKECRLRADASEMLSVEYGVDPSGIR